MRKLRFKKGSVYLKKIQGSGLVNDILNSGTLPEMHLPNYSYCGPGTKLTERLLQGQRGINKLDQACRVHDMQYKIFKDTKDRHIFDKELQDKAVKVMLSDKSNAKEKLEAGLVASIMFGKQKLGLGQNTKLCKK